MHSCGNSRREYHAKWWTEFPFSKGNWMSGRKWTTSFSTVFYSIYRLAEEGIANKKATSFFILLEKLGINHLKYFGHRSPASVRGIFSTLGCAVKENVVKEAKTAGWTPRWRVRYSSHGTGDYIYPVLQWRQQWDHCTGPLSWQPVRSAWVCNATAMFQTIQC